MGLFDFFRKKKTNNSSSDIKNITIFDDDRYIYTAEDYSLQKDICADLNKQQKSAIIIALGSFIKIFILKETVQREYADNLLLERMKMLGISYEEAQSFIEDADALTQYLKSIQNKQITDFLLDDVKYLLHLLVSITIIYRDGVEVNYKAINTMYGMFIPLGYSKIEIHNPRDFMYF